MRQLLTGLLFWRGKGEEGRCNRKIDYIEQVRGV